MDELQRIIEGLCFGAMGGALIVGMWITFRIEDRESTKRQGARPGQQESRFQAQSKTPWHRSNDMLADETHPSRKNKDDSSQE